MIEHGNVALTRHCNLEQRIPTCDIMVRKESGPTLSLPAATGILAFAPLSSSPQIHLFQATP
jgi:hypothetical protein